MDANTLARSLVSKIERKIRLDSPGNWPEIKQGLAEIGEESGYKAHLTDKATNNKEFLWDVIWINRSNLRLELAAESEMADEGKVMEDFQRLLYAKTDMKLMICDRSPARTQKLLHDMEEVLSNYPNHTVGEQYLVFDLDGSNRLLHCYGWRVSASGLNPSGTVKFGELQHSPFAYKIGSSAVGA